MKPFALLNKLKTAVKNPSSIYYFVLGRFHFFPIREIKNDFIVNLRTYCISLKQSNDRQFFMGKQVKQAGFRNFHFIEAVNASSLDIPTLVKDGLYDEEPSKKYHKRPLSLGEIACSLSHGKIYEKIVDMEIQTALVLEDDALFVTKRLNMVDPSIFPAGWDIIFLNSFLSHSPPRGRIRCNLYGTDSWEGSCAAYLISFAGASKLAKAYKPVIHAADGLVGRCMDYSGKERHHFKQQGARTTIKAYLIYPNCILNGSSIGFWNSTLSISHYKST
jgi:glycosyl transferase, family 25